MAFEKSAFAPHPVTGLSGSIALLKATRILDGRLGVGVRVRSSGDTVVLREVGWGYEVRPTDNPAVKSLEILDFTKYQR